MPLFKSQITYTFFISNEVVKDSGLDIVKKLSNCLAALQPQFSKFTSN